MVKSGGKQDIFATILVAIVLKLFAEDDLSPAP